MIISFEFVEVESVIKTIFIRNNKHSIIVKLLSFFLLFLFQIKKES